MWGVILHASVLATEMAVERMTQVELRQYHEAAESLADQSCLMPSELSPPATAFTWLELQNAIASLAWLSFNALPYKRGTPTTVLVIHHALWLALFPAEDRQNVLVKCIPRIREGVMPDLEAFATDLDGFVKERWWHIFEDAGRDLLSCLTRHFDAVTARREQAQASRVATTQVRTLRQRLQVLGLPRSGPRARLCLRLAGREHQVKAQLEHGCAPVKDKTQACPMGHAGSRNPLCELGECGDTDCALYRFRGGSEGVRSDFVNFCAKQIEEHFWQVKSRHDEGLVYCSLGCGCLYFDWELLDQLVTNARLRVDQVWLVDTAFWENATFATAETKALRAFCQWYAGEFDIHSFRTGRSLKRWCQAFSGQLGHAHVVMECDSVQTHPLTDDGDFCRSVLHEEALNLQIFSQRLANRRPGPGRRRGPVPVAPVRCVRRRKEDKLEILQRDQWQNGIWLPDYFLHFDNDEENADWITEDLQRRYR
ncbi:unnamed protein product [Symbiodinium pilosum]|uniref:SAP domain-containing protein n=1 Tax=Symbiodinium pilosum TaxID=2952 RepID=A0A812UG34_SYMPI|nr:unnamed protein product [Symbiodinium pilosum]